MRSVARARGHHRLLSALAFALLALVVELSGRSLTQRIDVGRHVSSPGDTRADYYPILLAAVKMGVALLLARLVWRLVRARSTAHAGRRVLAALGAPPERAAPRLRLRLSPRLWLTFFAVTALIYLVQMDAEGLSAGRWPLLAPWLHSSALPVFAVLSVFAAVVWSAVAGWLSDYESYARATLADANRMARAELPLPARPRSVDLPLRRLFGTAFWSRPPPVPA
jgi:hypothetical protein